MAYRRRHGLTRASTFKEDIYQPMNDDDDDKYHHNEIQKETNGDNANDYASTVVNLSSSSSPPSSSPHATHKPAADSFRSLSFPNSKGSIHSDSSYNKYANDSNYGIWGTLVRKAKSILEEDELESSNKTKSHDVHDTTIGSQFYQSRQSSEGGARIDNDKFQKHIDAITSSLNHLGDTIGNAFEDGCTIMEHKTADILQEASKLQNRKRGGNSDTNENQATVLQNSSWQRPVVQTVHTYALANQKTQLKASRDVAMATAAKAKVLLRELKTVKADLAFAKERCAQLEEENKRLRDSREKGSNPADDDLIRLQLETLLAEKARLAHENSIYARENGFLREIVEYHQLTMQEIVYLDEGAEEVTEICPFSIEDTKLLSGSPTSLMSPYFPSEFSSFSFSTETKEHTGVVPKEPLIATTAASSPLRISSLSSSPQGKGSSEVLTSSQRVENEKR